METPQLTLEKLQEAVQKLHERFDGIERFIRERDNLSHPPPEDQLLTVSEAAALLKLQPCTIYGLVHTEYNSIRSQFVTLEKGRGKYSKYLPFAFTEHGVSMLATVLKSKKARQRTIAIMRAFIAMKHIILHYKELNDKLKKLERKYNRQFNDVYEALNYLLNKDKNDKEQRERRRIGYK